MSWYPAGFKIPGTDEIIYLPEEEMRKVVRAITTAARNRPKVTLPKLKLGKTDA